ncbi:MAG: 50S ribosomal protein L6 [Clostridia bacterium]|nr:50S ribosomal protein L6 [Clostridia bacterium]
MSRIGRTPITIPAGVEVSLDGNTIRVKGPKGQLTRELHPEMNVAIEGEQIVVTRPSEQKEHRSLHGLTRTLVSNMVEGVTKGFSKGLDLAGVGYRAAMQGNKLVLTVGYSQPVEMVPYEGLEVEVPSPNKIIVKGIDKELVGAFAANVRAVRPPEPYKGKGIKYETETVSRKAGKTGAK